jgi:hypothetical protein
MKTSRICLIVAMVMSALSLGETRPAKFVASPAIDVAATNPLHAARLRKLHLVRPDLINYPLSFDVVC